MKSISKGFKQILNAIGDLVFVKGTDSKIRWANQAFCNFYGLTNEQILGMKNPLFNSSDQAKKLLADDVQIFQSGKSLDLAEVIATRADGAVRVFHTVMTPIFDAEKKIIMIIGISRDITEQKMAETDLKADRDRAITSSKMASLGEMAGGVAHEINTPLATLALLAGQCEDMLNEPSLDIELLKKNILKIDKTTKKIAKIISGLRNFSRDGKNDPMVNTRVGDIIEDTLSFSTEKIVSSGCKISVVHENPNLVAYCRATEISQVLLNLLCNSYDAISDLSEKWIIIESKVVGNFIELSVTDSGAGISESTCKKIFMPFFTTKENGKGTGLGLSISKRILETHNGAIFVDHSCPNTRFVMQIPLS